MSKQTRGELTRPIAWALCATLVFAVGAMAEIVDFSAEIECGVNEYLGSESSDTDFAFDSFPQGTSNNLPLEVMTQFIRKDSEEQLRAAGQAVTRFTDPRLSTTPSPEEIAITAVALSRDASLRHDAHGKATETRKVVFLANEVGATAGTEVLVSSRFFLDGVLAIWDESELVDLSNVSARYRLRVEQQRGEASPETVLLSDIAIVGHSDGTATIETNGVVQAANVVQIELTLPSEGLTKVHAIVIPDIAIPYSYQARVGESFTLTATVEGECNSRPGGRGAVVLLGISLDELAAVLDELVGGSLGQILEAALRTAADSVGPPSEPLDDTSGDTITPIPTCGCLCEGCGPLGIEALFLTLGVLGLGRIVPRRR